MKMGIQFEKLEHKEKLKRLIPLMEDVRDNHTYLNRINLIFRYFELSLTVLGTHTTNLSW